jgi:hypothetical protein
MGSLLHHEFKAELHNLYSGEISEAELIGRISKTEPLVLGVTCSSQRSYPYVKALVEKVCQAGFSGSIVLGGFYASLEYENIMQDISLVDIVVIGDGEFSFIDVLRHIKSRDSLTNVKGIAYREFDKIICTEAYRNKNLDYPFFPVRSPIKYFASSNMIDGKQIPGKYYNMNVGRGCYGRCSFCSICNNKEKRLRIYRSPANIMDELKRLIDRGINHFWFNDEIFYEHSSKGLKWLESFISSVVNVGLKFTFNIELRPNDIVKNEIESLMSIGLTAIFLGIESGVQRVLDEMQKDTTVEVNTKALNLLSSLKLRIEMGWISFIPTMAYSELVANYKYLFSWPFYTEENIYNKLNLYSGCQYENILQTKGLILPRVNFYDRFSYTFADKKVELFMSFVDALRVKFGLARKVMKPIQEKLSYDGDYTYYLFIRQEMRMIWRQYIEDLIYFFNISNSLNTKTYEEFDFYNNAVVKMQALADTIKL